MGATRSFENVFSNASEKSAKVSSFPNAIINTDKLEPFILSRHIFREFLDILGDFFDFPRDFLDFLKDFSNFSGDYFDFLGILHLSA